MSEYDIRAWRPGDEGSLLETYNLVFGAGDPAFRPRTLGEWEWAFQRNPAGSRVWLALRGEQVVAQYAALPYRTWVEGEERRFAQIVDSMVHPEHRDEAPGSGAEEPGLLVRTAERFFEAHGGRDRDLVHYGWPTEEAWRVGKAFLAYEVVRTQNFLVRELGAGAVEMPAAVEELERFDHEARWVYDRCVGDWAASVIRDEVFLNWRFADHPRHDYTALGVRDGEGHLRGYAVFRVGDFLLPRVGMVLDWLVPPGEPEVGELLLQAVSARAQSGGAAAVAVIFPEWSPWFERFQDEGFLVYPSHYFMVARNFHRRYDMLWLRDHWWYQLADTDLV